MRIEYKRIFSYYIIVEAAAPPNSPMMRAISARTNSNHFTSGMFLRFIFQKFLAVFLNVEHVQVLSVNLQHQSFIGYTMTLPSCLGVVVTERHG